MGEVEKKGRGKEREKGEKERKIAYTYSLSNINYFSQNSIETWKEWWKKYELILWEPCGLLSGPVA